MPMGNLPPTISEFIVSKISLIRIQNYLSQKEIDKEFYFKSKKVSNDKNIAI